ncbi:hypothetical protein DL766_004135 [Monosporascus sp. MC13-8B]|nr:hypothetical protein DL763_000043 [Monosporascus cannonballus]RYP32025.1 hypothetical protein DL766_004135 [Monosporascus sp. MC13-8B]
MTESDVDPSLLLFRRQYLQLFEPDFLAWPAQKLIRSADAQTWLYKRLFDESRNPRLPPSGYQIRVLEALLSRIQRAISNGEGDGVSERLMSRLVSLRDSWLEATQEKSDSYVTFTCIPENGRLDQDASSEPTVTLLERRYLISGSRVTGFRTWEGSLHLASYLLTETGKELVKGKGILELGAGTGLLSILCAKHLEARHVTATDGDKGVVEALKKNIVLNGLGSNQHVVARTLNWGDDLEATWVEQDCKARPYDVVIGADITYDKVAIKALVMTIHQLFELRPGLRVLIGGVVRNVNTFESFRSECLSRRFSVEELGFQAKPMRQQNALFYAAAVPIKILSVSGPG